jgi:hypothetical protein
MCSIACGAATSEQLGLARGPLRHAGACRVPSAGPDPQVDLGGRDRNADGAPQGARDDPARACSTADPHAGNHKDSEAANDGDANRARTRQAAGSWIVRRTRHHAKVIGPRRSSRDIREHWHRRRCCPPYVSLGVGNFAAGTTSMMLFESIHDWYRDNPAQWIADNALWILLLIALIGLAGLVIAAASASRRRRRARS